MNRVCTGQRSVDEDVTGNTPGHANGRTTYSRTHFLLVVSNPRPTSIIAVILFAASRPVRVPYRRREFPSRTLQCHRVP